MLAERTWNVPLADPDVLYVTILYDYVYHDVPRARHARHTCILYLKAWAPAGVIFRAQRDKCTPLSGLRPREGIYTNLYSVTQFVSTRDLQPPGSCYAVPIARWHLVLPSAMRGCWSTKQLWRAPTVSPASLPEGWQCELQEGCDIGFARKVAQPRSQRQPLKYRKRPHASQRWRSLLVPVPSTRGAPVQTLVFEMTVKGDRVTHTRAETKREATPVNHGMLEIAVLALAEVQAMKTAGELTD